MPRRPSVLATPRTTSFTVDRHLGMIRRGSRMNVEQSYVRAKGGTVSVKTFHWDLKNCYVTITPDGSRAIKQRNGIAKFNSVQIGSAEKVRVLFEARWASGTLDVIIRSGTSWKRYDGSSTFNAITGATSRTDDEIGQVIMFNNKVIMVDGGTALIMDSAYSVSSLGGSPPSDADAAHAHQHKVWLNSRANPMRAYYSATDDPEDYTKAGDAGYLDLSSILPVGDEILGYSTVAEVYLVIHCRKHQVVYYAGTEPADFELQMVIPVSCYSNSGKTLIGRELIIPSDEGLNSLSSAIVHQALETDDLTLEVSDLYRVLVAAMANLKHVSAAFYHKLNHLYLSFPTASDPQILVYDPKVQNIVGRYIGLTPYSWCERTGGTMLMGGAGYVYTFDSGTSDDGTAIDFSVELPFLWWGDLERHKAPREFEVLVQTDRDMTLTVSWWFGDDPTGTQIFTKNVSIEASETLWRSALWRSSYWRGVGVDSVSTFDMNSRGRLMTMKLSHSTVDAIITIPWWIVRFFFEGRE